MQEAVLVCTGDAQAIVEDNQVCHTANDVGDTLEGHDCAAVLQIPPPVREKEDCGHYLHARKGTFRPMRMRLLRTVKTRQR